MAGYIGTRAAVASPGTERKKTFAITTTTTNLTGLSYTPGFVHVYHNGIRLVDSTDYTATNGSTITLTTAAENGDEVVVVSYGTFSPADTYTKSETYNKTEADDRYVNASGDTMTGELTVNNDAATVLTVDRKTSDGNIALFKKDGTDVGSIGIGGGGILYNAASNYGLKFYDAGGTNIVHPATTAGADKDASVTLGYSGSRFKDLYLSGGVYLGGTGAANYLDDYEEGTWTPVAFGTSTAGTATYVQQKGYYVKIGRAVHYQLYLGWSGHTGTGTLRISGLPFSAGSSANVAYSAPSVAYTNGLTFGSGNLGGYIGSGGTFIAIVMNNSNATPTSISVDADVTELIISGMYITA